MDLDDKIYPLSHYITDQEELVNQMFLTIRGSKLEAMLPPVLKVGGSSLLVPDVVSTHYLSAINLVNSGTPYLLLYFQLPVMF